MILYEDMPPDGYHTITVSDEVFQRVVAVMSEYECETVADAVSTAPPAPRRCGPHCRFLRRHRGYRWGRLSRSFVSVTTGGVQRLIKVEHLLPLNAVFNRYTRFVAGYPENPHGLES